MTNKYDRKINDIIYKYDMKVTNNIDASEIESIIIKVLLRDVQEKKSLYGELEKRMQFQVIVQ